MIPPSRPSRKLLSAMSTILLRFRPVMALTFGTGGFWRNCLLRPFEPAFPGARYGALVSAARKGEVASHLAGTGCPAVSERRMVSEDQAALFRFPQPSGFRLIPLMREESLQFLRTLVNTPSPVGHEVRGQRVWLDYAKAFADETSSDAYGNCVAVLNKGGSPRLMIAGHADEIAMAVNYIDDQGFIYVRKMGGVDAAITKAQRVVIHTRNGPVKGVVGNVAPHLMKEEKDPKPPKIHDLFIDIGVGSRKDAEQLVRTGDPITLTR